ncbi:CvpA family protein [Simiduia aestuariiviva]|uniref:Putative membrane protein required for colicin V production n=1 Tax=Simiduia aestuariiviva TaxID=1510459 RepID=A0A839ULL1_9GAMM|nr:CvpA family protein [Simiduia aestuariiviva]MBB3167651.1 putative membrane protein required for colicin V production [Simiduia aestuariiviva]
MTYSPVFWVAVALVLGMGARGFLQGFSRSLFRLQLLVLALVVSGTLLSPVLSLTKQWFDWPLYFHQLVFGGLMFALAYSGACALMTRYLDRQTPEDDIPVLGWGSRVMGLLVGLLGGAVMAALVAFLAGVKPDFDGAKRPSNLLNNQYSLSDYGYETDAFDTPSESPVSLLINAIVLSPAQGVKLLQQTTVQPEFNALMSSPDARALLDASDIFGLTEDPTFDQLIATAPVQDLWALQRELEVLTDEQLERETAAQLVDAYHRIERVKTHPRVAELLADTPFRRLLQTADLGTLTRDKRVLELGDVIIGARQ